MARSWKRSVTLVAAGAVLVFFAGGLNLLVPSDSAMFTAVLRADDFNDSCSEMMIRTPSLGAPSASDNVAGGDIVPVRSVADPYPSLHCVAVDPENNRVVMSDSNRGSLLFYERTS
jgi:hypothetical protein